MSCGYVCPVCEGSGKLEDGRPCDYCQPKRSGNHKLSLWIFVFFLMNFSVNAQYTSLVNPMIGTGGHGHTFPGAVLPFGMVSVSPDTRIDGSWDGCSGYHDEDRYIYGFSHTHLSGTGCSDLGDVAWLPFYADSLDKDSLLLRVGFDKTSEKAAPGYYKVMLNTGITVELTAGLRTGYQLYTFPYAGKVSIALNLSHRDVLLSHETKVNADGSVSGFRQSKAWAQKQTVYFHAKFNKIPYFVRYKDEGKTIIYNFEVKAGESLMLATGISPVDVDGAKNNLRIESAQGSLTFETLRQRADSVWNRQLSCIRVDDLIEGKAIPEVHEKYVNLYTALYHCFIHPSLYHDADFRYRGRDGNIYKDSGFTNYTVFSLWDTYRSLHPLFNLIDRKHNLDFIQSMLHQYRQVGRLPVWELWGNETDCMIGYHALSVITDAWVKGVRNFDKTLALRAMLDAAYSDWRGFPEFRQKGFLTTEDESESVSKSLEYSYNYWCIAQFIKTAFDTSAVIPSDIERGSRGWVHLLAKSPHGKFFLPRVNGGMIQPFDPYEVNNHYTEANAWQYKFAMVHDLDFYISLIGGPDSLEKALDKLFQASTQTTGRTQDDISGLIGQYAHGNEPSHHIAWLYHYTKSPQKTFQLVRRILSEFYTNTPSGLIGNEDCGQMSAWYVWAACGLYPAVPGTTDYLLAPPLFDQVEIYDGAALRYHFQSGKAALKGTHDTKTPKISRHDNERKGLKPILIYKKDGTTVQHYKINALDSGCKYLYFSNRSLKSYVATGITSQLPLAAPFIQYQISQERVFFQLSGNYSGSNQYVYIYNSDSVKLYGDTFSLPFDKSLNLSVYACFQGSHSPVVKVYVPKVKEDRSILIHAIPNRQYTAGGPQALIDGQFGEIEWRKGKWQGYQDQDVTVSITLKESRFINGSGLNCLQDQRSWIMMPAELEIWYSLDSIHFERMGTVYPRTKDTTDHHVIEPLLVRHPPQEVKYIKMTARKYGNLPKWHPGAGHPAFIFTDEVLLDLIEK